MATGTAKWFNADKGYGLGEGYETLAEAARRHVPVEPDLAARFER